MNEDAAKGFLAVIAAVSVGFGAAWPFWLNKILDATNQRPDPRSGPVTLERQRQELAELAVPQRIYMVVTAFLVIAMVIATATVVTAVATGETWTWPTVTLVGAAGVWIVGGSWIIGRCRRIDTYRTMIDRWLRDAPKTRPPA
jgi:hypothetical protein